MNNLSKWLSSNTHKNPASRVRVKDLRASFLATLSVSGRASWGRTRFVAELAKCGYQVGVDSRGISHVAGLSMQPPKSWQLKMGRLVLL